MDFLAGREHRSTRGAARDTKSNGGRHGLTAAQSGSDADFMQKRNHGVSAQIISPLNSHAFSRLFWRHFPW
jgi:hypothetical protein